MEFEKVSEVLSGTMAKFLKESGKMEQKMVTASGNPLKVITMRVTGYSTGNTVKAFTNIK